MINLSDRKKKKVSAYSVIEGHFVPDYLRSRCPECGALKARSSKRCHSCAYPKLKAGERFGRLTIISDAGLKEGRFAYRVKCDCGREIVVTSTRLRRGQSACACGLSNHTHGHAKPQSPTYRVWHNMKQRCQNPKNSAFQDYGGRGIEVCERWKTFENFLADMGERPEGLSLDRFPNNDGNYEPGNCRWATRAQQQSNTRANRYIEYEGERLTLNEWARRHSVRYDNLRHYLNAGLPLSEAITAAQHSRRRAA